MNSRIRRAALLALGSVALAAPAVQAATGSASLSNIHIQIVGLFGSTPTLSLDNGYTWLGSNAAINGVYQNGNYAGMSGLGAAPSPVSFSIPGTTASAISVAGDLLGSAGWGGSASASAVGVGLTSSAYAQTSATFILGANTLMIVTADAPTVSGSASLGEILFASASLSLNSTDNSSSSYGSAYWDIFQNGDVATSMPGSLQASIVNLGSSAMTGYFSATANVTAQGVAAVPEPASVALLLAGLLGVGCAARRRQV